MESASAKKIRPKYLNLPAILFEIRLPVPPRAEPKARANGQATLGGDLTADADGEASVNANANAGADASIEK